ncbi:hypothetical protein [uncultured Clostridium sp.]|uniref:hypothetical protein n=1 Tax=uncultured Clostridium sp. TaxID=59620 RepID=UPI0028EB6E29|nr:hypothetical protein [uncultured Clostridium sp.]
MKKFIKKASFCICLFMSVLVCNSIFGNTTQTWAATPAQPISSFEITSYSDGTYTPQYDRNEVGTIKQENFPLIVNTYQFGYGHIEEVYVDGKLIPKVRTVDEFYSRGEKEPVFVEAQEQGYVGPEGGIVAWARVVGVSTLSKGQHTVKFVCDTRAYSSMTYRKISDSITINVE